MYTAKIACHYQESGAPKKGSDKKTCLLLSGDDQYKPERWMLEVIPNRWPQNWQFEWTNMSNKAWCQISWVTWHWTEWLQCPLQWPWGLSLLPSVFPNVIFCIKTLLLKKNCLKRANISSVPLGMNIIFAIWNNGGASEEFWQYGFLEDWRALGILVHGKLLVIDIAISI